MRLEEKARGYPFSESRVRDSFRKVRNRLRKHYPEEIILACIAKLNERHYDSIQHLRLYPPWRLLLLVKWTLLYGEYLSPSRRALNDRDFRYLLGLMRDLEGNLRLPSEYDNIFLFLRNLSFQQFWLQGDLDMAGFARQEILFGQLPDNHPYRKSFEHEFGVGIPSFLELAMMLMTRFAVEKQSSVTLQWFSPVIDKYGDGAIAKFLNLLSADVDSLRTGLKDIESTPTRVSYEVYEKTPLRHTPLLKHDEQFYPFSAALLARSMETFVYDRLRRKNPSAFMDKFGPIFERYVGHSLRKAGLPSLSERDLRESLEGSIKLVDYVVVDGGCNVLIDAKGVEMSYLGMVGHEPEQIKDRTKDSVVKGIKQGFDTASWLANLDSIKGTRLGKKNYLLVVTYKDLFLGNGKDFHDYVAGPTLDRLTEEYAGIPPIPYEQMYFISIDDFDLMMGGIASGAIGLIGTIEAAISADANPVTKKFTFQQHIREISPSIRPPKWLSEECRDILTRCAAHLEAR